MIRGKFSAFLILCLAGLTIVSVLSMLSFASAEDYCGAYNGQIGCYPVIDNTICVYTTDFSRCITAASPADPAYSVSCSPQQQGQDCLNACQYSEVYSCSGSIRTKSYSASPSSPSYCMESPPTDSGTTSLCSYGCASDGINCASCVPESDSSFCSRIGGCGTVTGNNNCGTSKTVNCGSCSVPLSSNGESCTLNSQCSSGYCSNGNLCADAPQCAPWIGNNCPSEFHCSSFWGGVCEPDVVTPSTCTANSPTYGSCEYGFKTNTTTFTPSMCSTATPSMVSCLGDTGDNCSNPNQCTSNICTSGKCGTVTPTSDIASINSATWTNMKGSTLTNADKEDTLKMVSQGTNLNLNGGLIVFKVYKKQSLVDTKVDEKTVSVTSTTQTSVESTFKPTEEGTYYFKVSAGSSERISGEVIVSSSTSNSPPIAIITSPQSGGIYYTGSNIQFVHSSYDVDDPISSVKWIFGDGSTASTDSAVHSYSSSGQKTITLEVTDSRGKKATSVVNVNLANQEGYTLFVFIEKPANQAAIVSSNLVIDYSAKESYVINTAVSGSPCTVTVSCIQGQCPSTTRASPSCASNPNAQVAVSGGTQGYTQILFNWTFKDGNAFLSSESGLGKVSGTKGFADYGIKNITLSAKYTGNGQSIQSKYSRGFTLFNQRQCSADGATWNKVENEIITEMRDTLSTTACAGVDLQAGTNDDCCPQGFTCSTTGTVGCKTDGSTQNLGCSSYTTQGSCSADSANRVRNELLWDSYDCGRTVNGQNVICSCQWNTQNNQCEMQDTNRPDSNPIYGTLAQCLSSTQTEQCVNGFQIVHIDSTVVGGGESPKCVDSNLLLPCGRAVVALPFFTTVNMMVAIVVIGIIYFIVKNKEKSKRKKK